VAERLAEDYEVHTYDKVAAGKRCQYLDINDGSSIEKAVQRVDLVINCCPHKCNMNIFRAVLETGTSYIDLSEDIESRKFIQTSVPTSFQYFVPGCGVAPGFIEIVASSLIKSFEEVEDVKMRVGALPLSPSNSLKYNLTWSPDGLINEYGNMCESIEDRGKKVVSPLEGYERIIIDGVEYEAFNTSGGLGTMVEAYEHTVTNLNYKTLRYVGHRDLMKFLMFDLGLNKRRQDLEEILVDAIPSTNKDKVIVYVSVSGWRNNRLEEETYLKTFYGDDKWTAIQNITGGSAIAVAKLVLEEKLPHKGFIKQSEIDLDLFLNYY